MEPCNRGRFRVCSVSFRARTRVAGAPALARQSKRADFERGDVERIEVKPLALEDLLVRPWTMLERNGGECVETVLVSTSSASDEVASPRESLV